MGDKSPKDKAKKQSAKDNAKTDAAKAAQAVQDAKKKQPSK
jgi:hypothetical protein